MNKKNDKDTIDTLEDYMKWWEENINQYRIERDKARKIYFKNNNAIVPSSDTDTNTNTNTNINTIKKTIKKMGKKNIKKIEPKEVVTITPITPKYNWESSDDEFVLYFKKNDFLKIALVMDSVNFEFGGYLIGDIDYDKHIITIEDIYIPKQKVSGAECVFDNNEEAKIINKYSEKYLGIFHSHNTMGSFFSITDKNVIQEALIFDDTRFVSIVFSNDIKQFVSTEKSEMEEMFEKMLEITFVAGLFRRITSEQYIEHKIKSVFFRNDNITEEKYIEIKNEVNIIIKDKFVVNTYVPQPIYDVKTKTPYPNIYDFDYYEDMYGIRQDYDKIDEIEEQPSTNPLNYNLVIEIIDQFPNLYEIANKKYHHVTFLDILIEILSDDGTFQDLYEVLDTIEIIKKHRTSINRERYY